MKISELFKKLGISLDESLEDDTDKDTDKDSKADEVKVPPVADKDNKEGIGVKDMDKEEGNVNDKVILEEGWLDKETMTIDESKIHDENVLKAILGLKAEVDKVKNDTDIEKAIDDVISEYKLNVSKATLRKNIDIADIKKDSTGKFTGIKEAIEKLKASEPGLFATEGSDKKPSPLKEGFNPADKADNGALTPEDAWGSRK